MIFIKTPILCNYVYFEFYPKRSLLSSGFLLIEALVSVALVALLALFIFQWCVSCESFESKAVNELRMAELARKYLDRFSGETASSFCSREAGYTIEGIAWHEPACPWVTWLAVTVGKDESMAGRASITFLGSRGGG